MGDTVQIKVNGAPREVPVGSTVADLLGLLGVTGRVAVERNHDVVPRVAYAETPLDAGDELDVVSFVGGG